MRWLDDIGDAVGPGGCLIVLVAYFICVVLLLTSGRI